jgi:hypothetical protein
MIRKIYEQLSEEDRKLLVYALEHEISQLIRLDNDRFIGVNVQKCSTVKVLESDGDWSYGEFSRGHE